MLETFIIKINRDLFEHEYNNLLKVVSPEKRDKLKHFYRFEDSQNTLLGEIIVRLLVHDIVGLPNTDIAFTTNEYGKPFLKNYPKFHFNISHSGKYIACAIDDHAVGIDIEEIKMVDLKIVERFFTADEQKYIWDQPTANRIKTFYNIWTMKESYIKREGSGLSISLLSFSVLETFNLGVSFFKICNNYEVVCNVCTTQKIWPHCKKLYVQDMLAWSDHLLKSRNISLPHKVLL